ncbi:MAG: hypothetical protein ABIR96_06770 [Bdellovibrionota bacterium]
MLTSALILASAITLQVEVQAWQRSCKEVAPDAPLSCGIPAAFKLPIKLETQVFLADAPEQARVSKLAFSDTELKGEIRFYSAHPASESGLPPYIQIQIETFAPFRSLCLQSVRLRTPFEASPTSCTGLDNATGKQTGLNVKVNEVTKTLSSSPAL